MPIPTTQLGKNGPTVSALGYGCMGISAFYKNSLTEEEAYKVLDEAVSLGATFFDTARLYGDNEKLIGRWLKHSGSRDKIFLATKFGVHPDTFKVDGRPEYVRESFEESMSYLGLDSVDLFYQHRIDSSIPIEVTVGAMAELVKEGKVKYLGLSECSAATLRRAYKVHPITAIQIEYSPFAVDAEQNGVMEAARELGVAVVAYSPLSRGFLTGAYKSPEDFPEGDYRRFAPRFTKENFAENLKLLTKLQAIADKKGCTVGQLCLAWEMSIGVIPIPGTTNLTRLAENCGSGDVKLTEEEVAEIKEFVMSADVKGGRYVESQMPILYADTVELPK